MGRRVVDPRSAEPLHYRTTTRMWDDAGFRAGGEPAVAVLGAVRKASPNTTLRTANNAPFVADTRVGPTAFSLNGHAFHRSCEARVHGALAPDAILDGDTDSEVLFSLTRDRIDAGMDPADAVAAVHHVVDPGPEVYVNLLLVSASRIVATTWQHTLYVRQDGGAITVASEALDPDGSWHRVPDATLLVALGRPDPHPPEGTPMTVSELTVDTRLAPEDLTAALRADATRGLTATPKDLPPKWFYDDRGSELFDEITRLDEYYPTRTERSILVEHADDIVAASAADTLVELGSGTSEKTRILLDAFHRRGQSADLRALRRLGSHAAQRGAVRCRRVPRRRRARGGRGLRTSPRAHSGRRDAARRVPRWHDRELRTGSASRLSRLARDDAPPRRDPAARHRPRQGSRSIGPGLRRLARRHRGVQQERLQVLNRELGAGFDPADFDHVAAWDAANEWIEMRLRARRAHIVAVPELDLDVRFDRGEEMRTEISAKFRSDRVETELAAAGFELVEWWTDPAGDFALSLARRVEDNEARTGSHPLRTR